MKYKYLLPGIDTLSIRCSRFLKRIYCHDFFFLHSPNRGQNLSPKRSTIYNIFYTKINHRNNFHGTPSAYFISNIPRCSVYDIVWPEIESKIKEKISAREDKWDDGKRVANIPSISHRIARNCMRTDRKDTLGSFLSTRSVRRFFARMSYSY